MLSALPAMQDTAIPEIRSPQSAVRRPHPEMGGARSPRCALCDFCDGQPALRAFLLPFAGGEEGGLGFAGDHLGGDLVVAFLFLLLRKLVHQVEH
jgi:hypothetical protein